MRLSSIFSACVLLALSSSAYASPDVDFPQPGYSYGGKVRSGPGMQYRQIGSLQEGNRINILNGTGVMMNGYEWFEIRYRNGRTGYQWGGIMCSQNHYPTIFRVCDGPKLKVQGSPKVQPPVAPAGQPGVNGYDAAKVLHPGGSFTAVGGGQWQEADANGRVNFYFQEQSRDEWSVYLFDASRNVSLKLDLHRRQVLYGVGNAAKTVLYPITGSYAQGRSTTPPARSNTVHYTCEEGLPLTVTYVESGRAHVLFTIDGSPEKRLDVAVSGSGSRYTNGRYTLYSKGNTAILENPSGLDKCVAR